MADAEVKLLADAKKLPLADRVAHTNWKARSAAYEDIKTGLSKVYEDSDPLLSECGGLAHRQGRVGRWLSPRCLAQPT